MKLRIQGNSIRLRIVRPEVARLAESGRIEETLRFAQDSDAILTYALVTGTVTAEIQVLYQPLGITVIVPCLQAQQWADSTDVGMYSTIDLGTAGSLNVSIEKDFACLDRSDADNKDTFPHPQLVAIC